MLHHSFSSSAFCMSIMIPIPKGSRGITLSSLRSNVFDHCIISCERNVLESDNLQFAYKSGTSTTQCVSFVTETVIDYLHNESDVYMCTIDASKAFDRVNLLQLFSKLRQPTMCPLYLRFLLQCY